MSLVLILMSWSSWHGITDLFQIGKVKVTQSCLTLFNPMDCPWNSLGQNSGVGSLSLLQGIFPTQGLNPGLLDCRRLLYQLSHKGNPIGKGSSDWERSMSKLNCHPAYLTYMQGTSCEMPGWTKHKLESRLLGDISITSDMQMTPPLRQKAKN